MGFDFGPPHTTVAQAYPVFVQWLGNDHMVYPVSRKITTLGQVGNSAIPTGFFICCPGNLYSAVVIGVNADKRFGSNDLGCQAAFHIACAPAENAPVD